MEPDNLLDILLSIPARRFRYYCNECGEAYMTANEFRCLCNPCAKEMGLPEETPENPYPGFFSEYC